MDKKVGIYTRCSTVEQSTDLQQKELVHFAEARGWSVVGIYDDTGKTGTNDNRPRFKDLLRDARERKLDIILIFKLDRFSRSLKDLVTTLQELTDIGVDFISLKDSIDMTNPTGRLMTHMLGAFAEFEASLIRSRVKAGLDHAKKNGTRLGRPPQVDHTKVAELRAQGLSLLAIAKRLGCSKTAVHKSLQLSRSQNR